MLNGGQTGRCRASGCVIIKGRGWESNDKKKVVNCVRVCVWMCGVVAVSLSLRVRICLCERKRGYSLKVHDVSVFVCLRGIGYRSKSADKQQVQLKNLDQL